MPVLLEWASLAGIIALTMTLHFPCHCSALPQKWELIQGSDMLDLLNECHGKMPEDMAAFYFLQVTTH